MSVKTDADEKRDSAISHIDLAIRALAEIVIHECPGHDAYTEDYFRDLDDAFNALRKILRNIRT